MSSSSSSSSMAFKVSKPTASSKPMLLNVNRPPPNPPKFLVVTDDNSKTSILKIEKINESSNLHTTNGTKPSHGLLPVHTRNSLKNSKTDAKGIPNSSNSFDSIYNPTVMVRSTNSYLGVKPRGAPIAPPKSLIVPSISESKSFTEDLLFSNSSSNDKNNNKSFTQYSYDTITDPVDPIGPDNPAKDLNENWTAYWDDAAAAVYYYNHTSGEATWIPPEI